MVESIAPSNVDMLREDPEQWNQWRRETRLQRPNLRYVDLSGASIVGADLQGADLSHANLEGTRLGEANLQHTKLDAANFFKANLVRANLANARGQRANFGGAYMRSANLTDTSLIECNFMSAGLDHAILLRTSLKQSDLRESFLKHALLIETNLAGADLSRSIVYGTAVWDANLDEAKQADLVISYPTEEIIVRADGLEVAQFLRMMMNNTSIRALIDTLTTKVVLILGRFTPARKGILDALRTAIRARNYIPVLFDFAKPSSRNRSETISTLAHLARFVLADITEPRSVAQELAWIVPKLSSVPVKPLLLASRDEYGMFETFRDYPWVLEPFRYSDLNHLLEALESEVIAPAELWVVNRRKQSP